MSGAPLLVATDLDGTLLRSDGTVSERTARAVAAVQRAGLRFVVATARPPRWMHDLLPVVGERGVAICSNGAFSYDVVHRAVLAERTMSRETVTEVVALLRRAVPEISFAVETRVGFGMEPTYVDMYTPPEGAPVADIAELLATHLPGKLLARAPALDDANFLATVVSVVGERAVVAFSGSEGLAEMSAPGVTKAAVLAEWCDEWGIDPHAVVAFGDMPNDLAMLRWAGTSYAVANAHPDVRRVASEVCPANDEDGVASVLESLATARAEEPEDHLRAGISSRRLRDSRP
ncbi:MAG: HAD family hydrolase [Nocardioidaceae bacterium]